VRRFSGVYGVCEGIQGGDMGCVRGYRGGIWG
jgi:hypothetical protein